MRWTPYITVAAVITDDTGNYLLVEERPDGRSVLNQPAGHLEAGEGLIEAVIREVYEETCHHFTPTGLVGIYRWPIPGKDKTYLRFCFSGTVSQQDPACTLDADILATHWVSLSGLEAQPGRLRSPLVLRCIHDAAASPPRPLDLLHEL